MTQRHIRIRSVPLMPAVVTGAWSGFVPGLFIGGAVGAVASFAAGAAVEWMRELSFTTGIQEQLLPFGDRIGALQTLQDDWFFVIPLAGIAVGLLGAIIGALTGAVVSASYGSLLGGIDVVVEEAAPATAPASAPAPAAAAESVKSERRRKARRRTNSAA
jgi:hypothetical protein